MPLVRLRPIVPEPSRIVLEMERPLVIKRIVCLANSRKLGGRCVAGKEIRSRDWIRPVSDRPHEEVSEVERRYEDGVDPRVLDVIDVPLVRHNPGAHQPENWLLDPQFYWVRMGQMDVRQLPQLVDKPLVLWSSIASESADGILDRISVAEAVAAQRSLYLIRVEDLDIEVRTPRVGKRKVKGEFRFGAHSYRLIVTDPVAERNALAQPDGRSNVGPCYLTISLGEPFGGYCYKLIAAVIALDQ